MVKPKRLAAAIAAVPAPQRQTLELAYFSGLSLPEIAARLQQPLESARSHLRAGLHNLGVMLRPA
jgi:RNA polymerase sigma-70 factor (ECF subfamily)